MDYILEEYGAPNNIDFLSIDIEGQEMEMLGGFSLARWKPKWVLLEDHVLDHAKHKHMTENGYQLIMRTGINSWYVPSELEYKLSWLAYWQYFRKYWLGLPW